MYFTIIFILPLVINQKHTKTLSQSDFFYQTLTSLRKQWKCYNNNCAETITKCSNNKCETVKYHFKSENYQPEVSKIENPPVEKLNHHEIFNFPQSSEHNATMTDFLINHPNLNSGLIDAVLNIEKSVVYWSKSKHVTKTCKNRTCLTTTQSCENGKCTNEMKTTETAFTRDRGDVFSS